MVSEIAQSEAHDELANTTGVLTAAAPRRLGYVDGFRAVAALYVVVGHMAVTIWPGGNPSGPIAPFARLVNYGHEAVALFIVLSGFSLMLPVARNANRLPHGVWSFYRRRARRIIPPYYAAMALALALIWLAIGQPTTTIWRLSLVVSAQSILTHVLLLQDFLAPHDRSAINYVFWSIALECQIYLFFPAMLILWRRYNPIFAALLIVVLSVFGWTAASFTWVGTLNSRSIFGFAPQFFGLFALGMLAASVASDNHTSLRNALTRWNVDVALIVAGVLVIPRALSLSDTLFADLATGVIAVGLLLSAGSARRLNPLRAALSWRPLVWIGTISYSLYLIHAPLIQLIWQYVLYPLRLNQTANYLLLCAGMPFIILVAWVFWRFCERPFLNTRPRNEKA